MTKQTISIIGECMVELQKAGELYKQSFGGDTLNTALYLSRLTHSYGINTRYVTGIGKDAFSQAMLKEWQSENINTEQAYVSKTKLAGLYVIDTTPDGERSFHYWRNDSAARYWLLENEPNYVVEQLTQSSWIYLSGISLAILPPEAREQLFTMLTQCRAQGVKIAFDNNYRPCLWENPDVAQENYRRLLQLTDLAFLTFDDEQMLYGDESEQQAVIRTQNFGVNEIVIKCGASPCLIVTQDDTFNVAANCIENIVDTTAAGDSFSAGYLAKRLLGGTPQQAAQMGHHLAGSVIQHSGAIIPVEFMPALN